MVLAACQRNLIYYPVREDLSHLLRQAQSQGAEPWYDRRGALIGWTLRGEGRPTAEGRGRHLVVFHGNAGHALDRTYYAEALFSLAGSPWQTVSLFEYPGYGARDGQPGEKQILAAADAAVGELVANGEERIFLLGESLGGGVAAALAGRYPKRIAGLILITPFTRLADVGRVHFPYLPVRWLLRERYDTVAALRGYHGPVAVLLAGRDEIVPARLGRELYQAYEGPKRRWVQARATHNGLDLSPGAGFWNQATDFLLGHAQP
ncbi:alpha/beta hydrolase [Thiohalobacter thiocyanaticus]|nr:alpha/beta hydrolase [Thiohalobacter thiocyanaticus]